MRPMEDAHDSGTYVMPWERAPSWLYLPHLTGDREEEGAPEKRRRIEQPRGESEAEASRRTHGAAQHGEQVRKEKTRPPPPGNRGTQSDDSGAEGRRSGAAGQDADMGTRGNIIRGQSSLPGARRGRKPGGDGELSCDDAQVSIGAALAARPHARGDRDGIRGQKQLPGASGSAKREAVIECIQRMRTMQEAIRAARGIQGPVRPEDPPSARLRALRERIAARATLSSAAPVCSTASTEAATAAADHDNGTRVEERADVVEGRRHQPADNLASWNSRKDLLDHLRAG